MTTEDLTPTSPTSKGQTKMRSGPRELYRHLGICLAHEHLEDALNLLMKIETEYGLPRHLEIFKAKLIELTTGGAFELCDVERILTNVLTVDPNNLDALNELGHFYLNVMDDAVRAKPLLQRALEKCQSLRAEVALGVAQCIWEVGSAEEALAFIEKAKAWCPAIEELDEKKAEIESMGEWNEENDGRDA